MEKTFLILDNVRSMENVGSIFRTADAAGVSKIYLCGITPKPPRKEIDKTALGATDSVDWEYYEDIKTIIHKLKSDGVFIIAVEQEKRSVPYNKVRDNFLLDLSEKTAFVVGNEVDGISKEILDLADVIAEIPMHGKKNSLNVSVATGIVLFKSIEK